MFDLAISTRRLRKVFGDKVAVRNLTLDVSRGEIFGFLGPNGAGKSTSVKMLLGLVAPSSGTAAILGRPADDVKTRAKVGFLPEHFRFYDWLTSVEFLNSMAVSTAYPMLSSGVVFRACSTGSGSRPIGQVPRDFSKGMLQRIGLAQALSNDPNLAFSTNPLPASIPSAVAWFATSSSHNASVALPCF